MTSGAEIAAAIAAGFSALATCGLVILSKSVLKATREYVQATKDIVAITHNPVIAIEIVRLDVPLRNDNIMVDYKLINVGNAPALYLHANAEIDTRFGLLTAEPYTHSVSHIAVSDDEEIISTFERVQPDLIQYMQQAKSKLLKDAPFPEDRVQVRRLYSEYIQRFSPLLVITVIFENHVGQYYKTMLINDLVPEPWNETPIADIGIGRYTKDVTFDHQELSKEEYRRELKRLLEN